MQKYYEYLRGQGSTNNIIMQDPLTCDDILCVTSTKTKLAKERENNLTYI